MSSTIRFADIHQYEIQSKIGEGGFSEFFRVKDLQTMIHKLQLINAKI